MSPVSKDFFQLSQKYVYKNCEEKLSSISVTVGNKEASGKIKPLSRVNVNQEAELKAVCPEYHCHLSFFSSGCMYM